MYNVSTSLHTFTLYTLRLSLPLDTRLPRIFVLSLVVVHSMGSRGLVANERHNHRVEIEEEHDEVEAELDEGFLETD